MRITIDFPEKIHFSTNINVRVSDLNYGNHLGNDSILSIVHEARMQFLASFNYSEMDIEGSGLIMADAAIQFKSEAFYGENLSVEISVQNFGRASFDLYYRINCNQRNVALVKTGMVFFDYEKRKIKPVPENFKNLFG